MSGKKVTFSSRRPSEGLSTSAIDKWVQHRDTAPPEPDEPRKIKMKRLTIDVSPSLHRRIKSQCAINNLQMADEIRDLLEKHFPENLGQGATS
ncbi:MAG TPA: hypothetical protein VHC22_01835 [Pirellulales bacterium]|nr:hypothetical protein [Pirellulales bacterium]